MFRSNCFSFFSTIVLALLLCACASRPTSLTQPEWQISGKLSAKNARESTTLLFHWQQQQAHYLITLMNPLGQVEISLSGDNHHANATVKNGRSYAAKNASELLYQLTGWQFPVDNLRLWIQGKADKSAQQLQFNGTQLTQFVSQQWLVNYQQFAAHAGQPYPTKIRLQHQQQPITVIFLIKEYVLF